LGNHAPQTRHETIHRDAHTENGYVPIGWYSRSLAEVLAHQKLCSAHSRLSPVVIGPGQDSLVTARCYTNDSHFFALGTDRALSVLRH
jgi:hypothetical protein